MNRSILCLALTGLCVALAHAAPAPAPSSEGPISDALAVRALLPTSAPPTATSAVMVGDGLLELASPTVTFVTEVRVRKVTKNVPRVIEQAVNVVGPDGKPQTVKRTAQVVVPVEVEEQYQVSRPVINADGTKTRENAKACKFFTVNADGKLESLDADKAAAMLKTKKSVLTGTSAEVDPRNLELIKPGTLYIAVPAAAVLPAPPPPPPPPLGKTPN